MRKKDGTDRWVPVRFNPLLGDKAQIVAPVCRVYG